MLPHAVELAPGLFRWVTYHDEWKQDVASVALDTGDALVLVDPLAPAALRDARAFWKALDATVAARGGVDVLVTLHYHRRSAGEVRTRYRKRQRASLWTPTGSVERLGLPVDHAFAPGDPLPGGIVAYPSGHDAEAVLWLPRQRALVTGDALLGGVRKPYRVCPQSWLPRRVRRADAAQAMAPLRTLPVELLVPTHGPAVTEGAREVLLAALDEAAATT